MNNEEYLYEWNIKLLANSKEDAQKQLAFFADIVFMKCDLEASLKYDDVHIISEKIK